MTITKTTRTVLKNGTIKGTICVSDGRRRHNVRYERTPNGHAEQWGAPTDVLVSTCQEFEKLCRPED